MSICLHKVVRRRTCSNAASRTCGKLHHFDDKHTLLSSAQCSRLLRDEIQRILFRGAFLELWNVFAGVDRTILLRHESFLTAIVDAADRLGPLVRSYRQYKVSCDAVGAGESE